MYEFAGGDSAFLALAAALHERCLQDPELNHPFSQTTNPRHLENLAEYLAEALGGPARYSESRGGHTAMLDVHTGHGAGDDFGPRFVACFMQAVDDARLSNDPDFRASLRSFIERATQEVMSYAPAGSKAAAGLPIPRWSWNGPE